jgi:uncharacterized DUF497 family protein
MSRLTRWKKRWAILAVFAGSRGGDIEGEDLYAAIGQTSAGRYLMIYFVHKKTGEALMVTARDMTKKEKRSYAKK